LIISSPRLQGRRLIARRTCILPDGGGQAQVDPTPHPIGGGTIDAMKVLILDDYLAVARQAAAWDRLPAGTELRVLHEPVASEEERRRVFAPYDVVVAMRERTRFPSSLLEQLPNLRLLVTTGTRNASIDLEACRKLGIMVCSAPGDASQAAPAELAWALILALAKRIPREHQAVLQGSWQTGMPSLLAGKCLGILGLGNLGTQVARIGRVFGMRVVGWNRNLTPDRAAQAGVEGVGFDALFRESDVVSLHLVHAPDTTGIVRRTHLRAMKPGALLVNTARAELIEPGALEEALAGRWFAGAGLDVFRTEPLPVDDPLRRFDNVILSPHLGYVTPENMTAFYQNALAAILAWSAGTPIRVLGNG
jgi:phosphoglycerate dehydrogenase-like enzyme